MRTHPTSLPHLLGAATLVTLALASGRARAEDCPQIRPTDPAGGGGSFTYDVPAKSFASPEGNFRVWYVESGKHAPPLTSTRTDLVPDSVATVAKVAEEALTGYRKMGFKDPIRDGDYPTCASNGGDDRYDIYLVAFGGGDGQTAIERCTTASPTIRCPGFMSVERKPGYATYLEGIQTIVPHEFFHMIQNAYDAKMDRFWAEGTAQWATKQLYPDLLDLERNLDAFFSETKRPIDAPPGGVTAGFLYGSAIWPVFLGEHQGVPTVKEVLEAEFAGKGSPLEAADFVLRAKKTSLADEFGLFAAWNAATGKRAGTGGYAKAAKYPMVAVEEFPDGVPAQVDDVTAGFAARYYHVNDGSPRAFTFEADTERLSGLVLPLVDGKGQVDKVEKLPTTITGEAIVVLAGRNVRKTDVPYSLKAAEVAVDAGVDAGGDAGPSPNPPADDGKSGCSCRTPGTSNVSDGLGVFAGMALLGSFAARRHRRNET